MKFAPTIWITICLLLTPALCQAEDDKEELKGIEITATRTSIEEENPASALTVITQEEIKAKQHMQVKDILREQASVNVVSPGPLGGTTTVFLRGAGSQSSLVLIDGVQVKSNTTGLFDFSNLQMDNIERIEILRGPQSTLWGADAVGGVINIVTKTGKGTPTHSLSFEGGSFATFKETLASSGSVEDFDYAATASRTTSEGFSTFNEERGGTEDDAYENTSFSSRMGYNFLGDGRVEFIGRYTQARSSFDGFSSSFVFTDTPNHTLRNETFYVALPVQKSLTPWWDAKVNTNFNYDELDTLDPTFGDSFVVSRTYTVDFQNNIAMGKYASAVFGIEHQIANGFNKAKAIALENRSEGYYLQARGNWEDRIMVNAGFRQDVNSRFDDQFTYKFEGAYRFKRLRHQWRAAYATGFRVPSVNEVLYPFFGNTAIEPEKSKNWEVGFEQKFWNDRIRFGANYFNTDYTNLIIFDFVTFIAQNIGSARSKGIESFANVKILDNLSLSANYTWNQAQDETNGQLLARRPRHTASASLNYRINSEADATVSVSHRNKMVSGTGTVGERTLLRAAVSYSLAKNIRLTARGENLLNEKYEESFGYGSQRISGYLGIEYKFN